MKVIFIPGLLSTHLVWGELNSIRKKYSCYDADVTGSTIEEMSQAIIQNLPSEDIAVIGISMGGYVAIDFALRNISNLKKLILINTTSNSVNENTIPDRENAILLAKKGLTKDVLKKSEGICYHKPKKEWLLLEEEMANNVGTEIYIKQQNAIINRKNYSNLIKNISCETLIISGREDKVIPYKDSIHIFEQIPNANLVLLSECGHLSTLEKGAVVTRNVINFLQS